MLNSRDEHELPLMYATEDTESEPGSPTIEPESLVNESLVGKRAVETSLYVSHFLSTWNSRVFEFSAVLFLAQMFPGTLLPSSIYAVVRSAAAIVWSPSLGYYIDHKDRLFVLRFSIGKQNCEFMLKSG